ncbi:polysaccharide deacetylase family protein [Pelagibius sp. CAU 1746]|uniref:polysaccharide deacetylase family protein n=1 Tax=Pelagibius sp. CAU 1746 TaxID=3140370 RepID=UPI00325AFAF2
MSSQGSNAQNMNTPFPRDLVGYGATPPNPKWPGNARLAVQFVVNIEEGAEYTPADGDPQAEKGLAEVPGGRLPAGHRDLAFESMYEYGSRVGIWRLLRLFRDRGVPWTAFACAVALERNPMIAEFIRDNAIDVVCHGWRWEEPFRLSEEEERERIARSVESLKRTVGRAPEGWYCRYGASENTRRLLVEHGGFLYDSDSYNDEVPFWVTVLGKEHLVVPYAFSTNDSRFSGGGMVTGEQYFTMLREAFDYLYEEGKVSPRMMSIGLHARITGHPMRAHGLRRFLDYVLAHESVWICTRSEIAHHWHRHHRRTACL